jgi:hypothetical protein
VIWEIPEPTASCRALALSRQSEAVVGVAVGDGVGASVAAGGVAVTAEVATTATVVVDDAVGATT